MNESRIAKTKLLEAFARRHEVRYALRTKVARKGLGGHVAEVRTPVHGKPVS